MEQAARDSDSPFNKSVVEKTYVCLARAISALSTQREKKKSEKKKKNLLVFSGVS
jgi:hypothetical protein